MKEYSVDKLITHEDVDVCEYKSGNCFVDSLRQQTSLVSVDFLLHFSAKRKLLSDACSKQTLEGEKRKDKLVLLVSSAKKTHKTVHQHARGKGVNGSKNKRRLHSYEYKQITSKFESRI